MTEEEKKITREKHPGRAAQGHKLSEIMKKREEEILPNKGSLQCSLKNSVKNSLQCSLQNSLQCSLQYSQILSMALFILAVLAIVVCGFFAYNTFQPKKQAN